MSSSTSTAARDDAAPLRVLAFTRGRDVASARFRVQQYTDRIRSHGIELVEAPARLCAYPPVQRAIRPLWGAGVLAERAVDTVRSWKCDVTLFQREMISTLLTFERLTRRPRVLDVDDAIWLSAGPSFLRRLSSAVDRIICGNDYLADTFARHNPNVVVIPTAVDTDRFQPDPCVRSEGLLGWSGVGAELDYLHGIEPALLEVFRRFPQARLRVMCDRAPRFTTLDPHRVEYLRWSRTNEVRAIQDLAIGLMPLPDTPWARGKCSYKMLLYAACGVPSVVSPVGMNAQVATRGACSLLARSHDEWVDALSLLLSEPARAQCMGAAGRELVVVHFSTAHWTAVLGQELHAAAAG